MFQDYLVDGNTCHGCKTTLVRVPQSVYPITEFAPTMPSYASIAAQSARSAACSLMATGW
jgi:hypothetical protein